MKNNEKYGVLFDILIESYEKYKEEIAFIYNSAGQEFKVDYEKFFDDVLLLARAFRHHKIKKGTKVLFLSDNRYEWIVTDMALVSIGAISIPRGSDTPELELEFIIKHSECEYAILENEFLYEKHKKLLHDLHLKEIFIMEAESLHKLFGNEYSYNDILTNKEISNKDIDNFINERKNFSEDDIFTIIYTSGTTGTPKGVMLSNKNIMYNIKVMPPMINLEYSDVWLSILPSWHIFERAMEYIAIANGCKMVYSNIKTFSSDLIKYKPTLVATVPRLWESMYTKINAALQKQDPKKAKIFNQLVNISKKYNYHYRVINNQLPIFNKPNIISRLLNKIHSSIMLILLFPLKKFADKKMKAVHEKFGGKLRMAISGGGSLPKYLDEWIDALGIRIVNAYGMTECAPAIAGRALNCETFGTLGLPVEGCELRIVNSENEPLPYGVEGEIQVKGDQVMPGYYKNEDENHKVFTKDGFFKTGDLGKLTINGELVITGRSKEIIVLASGENIDPSRIESTITKLPFINDAVLVGQDKKGLGALIVPDFEKLKEFVASKIDEKKLSAKNWFNDTHVINTVKNEINKILHPKEGFKPFEKIQNIHFLEKEFKPGEELTNTFKKKRHIIEKKYKEIINKLLK
jgi:long-chain acyl-CoA synthetase